jgi:hypothetical protein
MLGSHGFNFQYRTKRPSYHKSDILIYTHIYVFHTPRANSRGKGDKYVVNIEEYKNNVFIMKFFKQKHSDSNKRYSILTNEFIARKIIMTCVNIGIEMLQKNNLASFGFLGMPTLEEIKRPTNKTLNTKRYRVYQKFASFFFKEENFEHNYDVKTSAYFMLNRNSIRENKNIKHEILNMFNNHYVLENFFQEIYQIGAN